MHYQHAPCKTQTERPMAIVAFHASVHSPQLGILSTCCSARIIQASLVPCDQSACHMYTMHWWLRGHHAHHMCEATIIWQSTAAVMVGSSLWSETDAAAHSVLPNWCTIIIKGHDTHTQVSHGNHIMYMYQSTNQHQTSCLHGSSDALAVKGGLLETNEQQRAQALPMLGCTVQEHCAVPKHATR